MNKENIIFAIHDLNYLGGQERSTLEIINRIKYKYDIEVHSFTLEPKEEEIAFRRVYPNIQKPALLKIIIYHLVTFIRFLSLRLANKKQIICSTGACSLISDIIHVQFVHASWNRKKTEISPYRLILSKYNELSERLVFSKNKKYIAISNSVKKSLIDEFQLTDITVVHHGVDIKKFSPAKDLMDKVKIQDLLNLSFPNKKILLYVGTYERKGLDKVMQALALLTEEELEGIIFLAIGAGDRSKYENLANQLGIHQIVRFLAPKKNIHEYFKASDIFVLPTQYEPFGLVALEAMSCGLPVIISKIAGAAELITHGVDGMLIQDPFDQKEISELLRKLIMDSALRYKMGYNARKRAELRSWDIVAKEYDAVISGIKS